MSYNNFEISWNETSGINYNQGLVGIGTNGVLQTLVLNPAGTSTTLPQLISSTWRFSLDGLQAFDDSENTGISYQFLLDGVPYYWSESQNNWFQATVPVTAANVATTTHNYEAIQDICPFLFSNYGFTTPLNFGLLMYFYSALGSSIQNTETSMQYFSSVPINSVINRSVIYGNFSDLVGTADVYNAATPATLLVTCDRGFVHSGQMIQPFTKTFNFDQNGFVQAEVIETTTPGVKLQFQIIYYDGLSTKTTRFYPAIVPNQPAVSLSNLTSPIPYDFG